MYHIQEFFDDFTAKWDNWEKKFFTCSLLALGITLVIFSVFSLVSCAKSTPMAASPTIREFLKDYDKPVVIKFYAKWCSTCKVYEPAFMKVQSEMSGSVDFISLNIDDTKNKKLIKEFKISRIPDTVFVSKDRETINKKLGPLSYRTLKEATENLKAL